MTYAIFLTFFVANLLLLVLGYLAIRGARYVVLTPPRLLMPVILLFCIVGSFAITNSVFGIAIMLVLGIVAFLMEENGVPIAPAILGIVIGPMLEDNFMATMIKSGGSVVGFFDRPASATLGGLTILVWTVPLIAMILRRLWKRSEALT